MKKFVFIQTDGNAILTLKASDYKSACDALDLIVVDILEWECDDEDGEDLADWEQES